MNELLEKKPLLIVSNHNAYNKPSRTKLIKAFTVFAKHTKNIQFFNPTELIVGDKKKYLYNENHYTPKMHLRVSLEIFKKIKQG